MHARSRSPAPATPARVVERRIPPAPARASRHPTRFEPRSHYARVGRPLLRCALLGLCLPLGLVLGLPIALWNAFEFGPRRVFFRQRRIGQHGRSFWIVKFRTMRGEEGSPGSWRVQDDDTRVTRCGRCLRNTHLDELPQLWNILRGEMDFIGPRPEMVEVDAWARARLARFDERHAVRPGVTGLAQVTQGYTTRELEAYRRKLELDLVSLSCCSLALDLEILARTAWWMLRARGWRAERPATGCERA